LGRSDAFADPEAKDRTNAVASAGAEQDQVGSVQADSLAAHNHTIKGAKSGFPKGGDGYASMYRIDGSENDKNIERNAVTEFSANRPETRPKNIYVHYIIKY